ncbi:MAG: 2OG-Fe(II) oxygenase [Pseudomonadota bacterium]|nr:2OG-Fe(II) oxygenase [Pseudomonadota bacterium]
MSSAWWAGDPDSVPLVEARAAPHEILAIENFLDRSQCELIRAAFNMSRGRLAANLVDPFWSDRLLWFDQIDPRAIGAKAVMQQARFVIAYRLAEHFGVEGRLYSDSQQLVSWNEGHSMPVHVDNAHPDGSKHDTPHRDFAAVLYLNEEFEGGHVFFPLQGVRLKPSTGLLVGFRGTAESPHGVTAVRKGERFTMPCWYSLDPSVAERSMFTIF